MSLLGCGTVSDLKGSQQSNEKGGDVTFPKPLTIISPRQIQPGQPSLNQYKSPSHTPTLTPSGSFVLQNNQETRTAQTAVVTSLSKWIPMPSPLTKFQNTTAAAAAAALLLPPTPTIRTTTHPRHRARKPRLSKNLR